MFTKNKFNRTTENYLYFERFKKGEEQALSYIHQKTFKYLFYHARGFISDEFTVNSMVQETFMKAWEMREQMESMFHVYCFMKMNLSWLCLKWMKNPKNLFLMRKICYTGHAEAYSTLRHYNLQEAENMARCFDEERMEAIEMVIPYLPPDRQVMIDLYFKQGLSYKAIARRFATSNMSIHSEVKKGLEQLKMMINQKKKKARKGGQTTIVKLGGTDSMDMEMSHIYRLRYEHKMGFATIAQKMHLDQGYVQRKYVEAHALMIGMAV